MARRSSWSAEWVLPIMMTPSSLGQPFSDDVAISAASPLLNQQGLFKGCRGMLKEESREKREENVLQR